MSVKCTFGGGGPIDGLERTLGSTPLFYEHMLNGQAYWYRMTTAMSGFWSFSGGGSRHYKFLGEGVGPGDLGYAALG